ncbi:hypothetical protein DERP_013289 [Dermatophagoides pteronyssinus]|uniref:Uncharacterized protein n=1 Tax=Dermatophagoides pteronyssinus TaxID=6956 RepID=A0ABQ8J3G8_DERPT|nr:hypothetical protein DERP_013289 [Dermatophagoides pteronyssinus]
MSFFVSGPNIDNNNKKFSLQLQIIFIKDFLSFSYGSSKDFEPKERMVGDPNNALCLVNCEFE